MPPSEDTENAYCCQVDEQLNKASSSSSSSEPRHPQPPGSVLRNGALAILSAQKTSDNGGSSYVAYTIRLGQNETKRRYSEFESLRKSLCRLHPTLIIPPIPEKHSIADYATMQNRTKDDLITIEKRKRMLQSFLNRLARHPILSSDHVFHRFLEPDTQWSEVLHSAPLIHLPKNPLTASPGTATNPASNASSTPPLAVPSSSQTLKNPDPRFVECEAFTNRFATHMSGPMDKSQKKLIRKLADLANDYAELGALYNGFSLNESGNLAAAIEKVGQAIDSSYMSTGSAVTSLEADVGEPLQEYEMFGTAIKSVLKYRHLKHVQVEQTAETLEHKRVTLEGLERAESEARRIEESLKRATGGAASAAAPAPVAEPIVPPTEQESETQDGESRTSTPTAGQVGPSQPASGTASPAAGRHTYGAGGGRAGTSSPSLPGNLRRGSGSKLLNALSHTIHGMMDVDPEATRRSNIGKTKDAITLLEEQLEKCSDDLTQISASIQDDLNRFQKRKVCDVRDILLAFARIHVKLAQKNMASWEEAQLEVDKIIV